MKSEVSLWGVARAAWEIRCSAHRKPKSTVLRPCRSLFAASKHERVGAPTDRCIEVSRGGAGIGAAHQAHPFSHSLPGGALHASRMSFEQLRVYQAAELLDAEIKKLIPGIPRGFSQDVD